MKTFLTCFFLCSAAAISAGEEYESMTLIFPPFEKEDMAGEVKSFRDHTSYEEMNAISVKDLRGIMTTGEYPDQYQAAITLLERNDQKTILRLVYSLKQGNAQVESMLRGYHPLSAIPYLLEDVAHGSLEYYEKYPPGGDIAIIGRVRSVASEVVASALANSPVFTGETRDCLRAISVGSDTGILTLSEKSRYLLQWWQLNEHAFSAEKWEDTQPLPQEIRYPDKDTGFPPRQPIDPTTDPSRLHPKWGPKWELPESFEAWSKRIVDPKRRNLDFIALSWDGKKVIEHPAKSLGPKASVITRQDRASRRVADSKATDEATGTSEGTRWLAWCAALVVFIGLIKLLMRPRSA